MPLWSLVVRLSEVLSVHNWDLNLSSTTWANNSISYVVLESYRMDILENDQLRICFACFYIAITFAYAFYIMIHETSLLVAGLCWMETVNNFKKEIELDQTNITGNEVN